MLCDSHPHSEVVQHQAQHFGKDPTKARRNRPYIHVVVVARRMNGHQRRRCFEGVSGRKQPAICQQNQEIKVLQVIQIF